MNIGPASATSRRTGQTELYMGPFNPFSNRPKNTKVRWFETELSKFYSHVENQPLLTHTQELQYGKAMSMWLRVCTLRAQLEAERISSISTTATSSRLFDLSENEEFAAAETDGKTFKSNLDRDMLDVHVEHMECDLGSSTASPDSAASSNNNNIKDQTAPFSESNLKPPSRIDLQGEAQSDKVTDEELAAAVGCSTSTLDKIQRCAEISRSRLVNSNLKLVLAVVSRYRTSAIPNAELIAEGTRGLSRAVDRFDYTKGFRFATYATWYVHQAVSEYVRWRKHPAKMPSRYLLLQRKVKDFTAGFKEERNRNPQVTEIALALGQSEFDVIKVLTMQTYPVLMNAPLTMGQGPGRSEGSKERTIEDILPSKFKNPTMRSDSNDLRNDMEKLMQVNLNDVERDVLRLRLGLDDGREKAVKEVGRRFKISWKQVRSVEREALSKLMGSQEIREFVQNYESQPLSSV